MKVSPGFVDAGCVAPPTLENTVAQSNVTNWTVGAILSFSCVTGFEFPEGVSARDYRCSASSAWVTTNDSLSNSDAAQGCQRKRNPF